MPAPVIYIYIYIFIYLFISNHLHTKGSSKIFWFKFTMERNMLQSHYRAWMRCPQKPCRNGSLSMRKPSTCRGIKWIHNCEDDATWTTSRGMRTIINYHVAASQELAAEAGFLLSSWEDEAHQERQTGSQGNKGKKTGEQRTNDF